jgi:hypothetical protein
MAVKDTPSIALVPVREFIERNPASNRRAHNEILRPNQVTQMSVVEI